MTLGARIKQWRKDAGNVTQVRLAAMAQVSPRTVQSWEADGSMTLTDFLLVCRVLRVPVEESATALEEAGK